MKPLFVNLKALIRANGITITDIANKTNRSIGYYTVRFSGEYAFNIEDIYVICDMIGAPYADIPTLFPRGGKDNARLMLREETAV